MVFKHPKHPLPSNSLDFFPACHFLPLLGSNAGDTTVWWGHWRAEAVKSNIHGPPHTHVRSKRSSQARIAGVSRDTRCWASDRQPQRVQSRRGSGGRTPRLICRTTSRRCAEIWTLGGNRHAVVAPAWVVGASPNVYLIGTGGNGGGVGSTQPNRPSSTGLGRT